MVLMSVLFVVTPCTGDCYWYYWKACWLLKWLLFVLWWWYYDDEDSEWPWCVPLSIMGWRAEMALFSVDDGIVTLYDTLSSHWTTPVTNSHWRRLTAMVLCYCGGVMIVHSSIMMWWYGGSDRWQQAATNIERWRRGAGRWARVWRKADCLGDAWRWLFDSVQWK